MTTDDDGRAPDADRPAWNPAPLPDDSLEGYETATRRFTRTAGPILAVVLAVALLIPAVGGLIRQIGFWIQGERVTDELAAEELDEILGGAVLLVGGAPCAAAGTVSGTAFAAEVDGETVVLTNRHVVEDVARVGLRTLSGSPGPRVASWRTSSVADVAVLALEDPGARPAPLEFADAAPATGTQVRTVGFPRGRPFTTAGPVVEVSGARVLLDLEVDPGASGSPVVDEAGRVVAQVYARTEDGRGVATSVGALRSALDALDPPTSGCGQ